MKQRVIKTGECSTKCIFIINMDIKFQEILNTS